MIKVKNGKATYRGSAGELLADLSVIVRGLHFECLLPYFPEEKAKDMILDTVETAILPEDECLKHMAARLLAGIKAGIENIEANMAENEKEEDE